MTTKAAPTSDEPILKMTRITLRSSDWTRLRVMAAEEDVSVSRLIGTLLEREILRSKGKGQ